MHKQGNENKKFDKPNLPNCLDRRSAECHPSKQDQQRQRRKCGTFCYFWKKGKIFLNVLRVQGMGLLALPLG